MGTRNGVNSHLIREQTTPYAGKSPKSVCCIRLPITEWESSASAMSRSISQPSVSVPSAGLFRSNGTSPMTDDNWSHGIHKMVKRSRWIQLTFANDSSRVFKIKGAGIRGWKERSLEGALSAGGRQYVDQRISA